MPGAPEQKNQVLQIEVDRIAKSSRDLQDKIAKLDAEQPPLVLIKAHEQQLAEDLHKFNKLIELLTAKIQKREQANQKLRTDRDALGPHARRRRVGDGSRVVPQASRRSRALRRSFSRWSMHS